MLHKARQSHVHLQALMSTDNGSCRIKKEADEEEVRERLIEKQDAGRQRLLMI